MTNLDILIVDDDPYEVMITKSAIRNFSASLRIESVESAEQALDYLKKNEFPDLIFLDVKMPRINGLELLRSMKSLKGFDRSAVYMLTNSNVSEEREEAFSLGATGHIKKEISMVRFRDKISQVLSNLEAIHPG